MFISAGWFMLVGGAQGVVRCATAKKFFRSDFANSDGVIDKEDHSTEIGVTSAQRWMLVGICGLVAVVGAIIVQHDRNWNPFQ